MDKYGEYSKLGLSQFDGTNYALWSIQMKLFLQSQELDVWMAVKNGYTGHTTTPVRTTIERRLMECNEKVVYSLLGGLIGP